MDPISERVNELEGDLTLVNSLRSEYPSKNGVKAINRLHYLISVTITELAIASVQINKAMPKRRGQDGISGGEPKD